MSRSLLTINEMVSLTIMILMVIALVAGQASAEAHAEEVAEASSSEAGMVEEAHAPFRTTISAHIDGHPLRISIDAVAELSYFRFEDE